MAHSNYTEGIHRLSIVKSPYLARKFVLWDVYRLDRISPQVNANVCNLSANVGMACILWPRPL